MKKRMLSLLLATLVVVSTLSMPANVSVALGTDLLASSQLSYTHKLSRNGSELNPSGNTFANGSYLLEVDWSILTSGKPVTGDYFDLFIEFSLPTQMSKFSFDFSANVGGTSTKVGTVTVQALDGGTPTDVTGYYEKYRIRAEFTSDALSTQNAVTGEYSFSFNYSTGGGSGSTTWKITDSASGSVTYQGTTPTPTPGDGNSVRSPEKLIKYGELISTGGTKDTIYWSVIINEAGLSANDYLASLGVSDPLSTSGLLTITDTLSGSHTLAPLYSTRSATLVPDSTHKYKAETVDPAYGMYGATNDATGSDPARFQVMQADVDTAWENLRDLPANAPVLMSSIGLTSDQCAFYQTPRAGNKVTTLLTAFMLRAVIYTPLTAELDNSSNFSTAVQFLTPVQATGLTTNIESPQKYTITLDKAAYNGKAVFIGYYTDIDSSVTAGTALGNSVTLSVDGVSNSTETASVTSMQGSGSAGGATVPLKIQKNSSAGGGVMNGVEFSVVRGAGGAGHEWTIYTDINGVATIPSLGSFSSDDVYTITETDTITGYVLYAAPIQVKIHNTLGTITLQNPENHTDYVSVSGDSKTLNVKNDPAPATGSISIKKTLVDETNPTKEFTVYLKNSAGDYLVFANSVYTGTGTQAAAAIQVKHDEILTFTGIPVDTVVTLEEAAASQSGYDVTYSANNTAGVTIAAGAPDTITVTNTKQATPPATGSISIKKTLAEETDPTKEFTVYLKNSDGQYLVFASCVYTGTGTQAAAAIQIKHNETLTFTGIPVDTVVTLEEAAASQSGYDVTYSANNTAGVTIAAGAPDTITVTNTKQVTPPTTGSISVQKVLEGETDNDKVFTVYLKNGDGEYLQFTGTEYAGTGDLSSATKIYLKHNETKTFTGIPVGMTLFLEEDTTDLNDYTVTYSTTNTLGITIAGGAPGLLSVTNTLNGTPPSGSVSVRKILAGENDPTRAFTVYLKDSTGAYLQFAGDVYAATGDRASATSIALTHNQTKVFTGLPIGMVVFLEEDTTGLSGYNITYSANNVMGVTIAQGASDTITVTNTKPTPPPIVTPEETPGPTPTATPTATPSPTPSATATTAPPTSTPTPPPPATPGNSVVPSEEDPNIFIEIDEDGTPLGEWHYDDDLEEWIYEAYPPLGAIPSTGRPIAGMVLLLAVAAFAAGIGILLIAGRKRELIQD